MASRPRIHLKLPGHLAKGLGGLLRAMLRLDARRRYTLPQVSRHGWFQADLVSTLSRTPNFRPPAAVAPLRANGRLESPRARSSRADQRPRQSLLASDSTKSATSRNSSGRSCTKSSPLLLLTSRPARVAAESPSHLLLEGAGFSGRLQAIAEWRSQPASRAGSQPPFSPSETSSSECPSRSPLRRRLARERGPRTKAYGLWRLPLRSGRRGDGLRSGSLSSLALYTLALARVVTGGRNRLCTLLGGRRGSARSVAACPDESGPRPGAVCE